MSLVLSNHGGHASGLGGMSVEFLGFYGKIGGSTFEFTRTSETVDIGPENPTRDILVAVTHFNIGYLIQLEDATINGVPATRLFRLSTNNWFSVALYHARLATGTDAAITVTSSINRIGLLIFHFYRIVGKKDPLVLNSSATLARVPDSNAPIEVKLDLPKHGILIAGGRVDKSGWTLSQGVGNTQVINDVDGTYSMAGFLPRTPEETNHTVRISRVSGSNSTIGCIYAAALI